MKMIAIAAGLAGLLLFPGSVWADGAKKEDHSGHGTTHIQSTVKPESAQTAIPSPTPVTAPVPTTVPDPHAAPAADEHKGGHVDEHKGGHAGGPSDAAAVHEGGNAAAGGHGHGHGDVTETPPNLPVLGAFGAINAGFILLGVWKKWIGKRGSSV